MSQFNSNDSENQDKLLLDSIAQKIKDRKLFEVQNHPFRNESLANLVVQGFENKTDLENIFTLLKDNGCFELNTEKLPWKDIDGEEKIITINRASKTNMWPMGTNFWVRDNAVIAARLLSLTGQPEQQVLGKELLLSNLTIASSQTQLARMEGIISGELDKENPNNWPHIFLNINDNLNASQIEPWMHKQDAWQILAYYIIDSLEKSHIKITDLSAKHQKFIGLIIPFLHSINYFNCENGGSWEEIAAIRTSVLCWEVAVLDKLLNFSKDNTAQFIINGFDQYKKSKNLHKSFLEFTQELLTSGINKLKDNIPFESPDYTKENPKYREADAALIYLLSIDIFSLFGESNKDYPDQILTQIAKLEGDHGIKRYLGDSYQGLNYFTNTTTAKLGQGLSGDSSGVENFIFRAKAIEFGYEAEWTHFIWQLSSAYGRLYQKSGKTKFLDQQKNYFLKGLSLITGENEVSIHQNANKECEKLEIPAFRLPECYMALKKDNDIFYLPSPHTPLYWSVAECLMAFEDLKVNLQ